MPVARLWPWLLAAAALLIGLTLTALAARWHHYTEVQSERAGLARLAERGFVAIEGQLRSCALRVRAVQTALLDAGTVSGPAFDAIYANMRPRNAFPSLLAFGYAERRRVGGRDLYITTHVAPRKGNERVYGLDVATQPANFAAIEYSRDSDLPALSAAFPLVQVDDASEHREGVVIRLPLFSPGARPAGIAERRRRIVGSLAVSFRIQTLIATALPGDMLESLHVRVDDVTGGARQSLYDSRAGPTGASSGDAAGFGRELRFGGRAWRIELRPRRPFAGAGIATWLIVAGGGAASLLLAGLLLSVSTTHRHALALADAMSARYRDSEARFRVLSELLPALVLLARAERGHLSYVNHAARERLGIHPGRTNASHLDMLLGDPAMRTRVATVAQGGVPLTGQNVRLRDARGGSFWASLSVSRIDLGGEPHLLAVASDVSELRELNERLSYQASHDALTDLYNRREFERRLDVAIDEADRGGTVAALLYIDLDQFKLINDTSGHFAGDQLLAHLAGMIRGALRPGDVLARLGGDEFGALIAADDAQAAREVAETMRARIDGYVFAWEQKTYAVSASIGVVMLDRAGMSQRELLSRADTACYIAKERGRNRVHVFSDDDLESIHRRGEMEWVNRVRLALNEGRLTLDYQELQKLKPARERDRPHIELLLRLRDEDDRIILPGAFVPAAERYGLMPQIDRWVVETALANFSRLHPSGGGLGACAINLSASTLEDEDFAGFVLDALARHDVPANRLCFEITETAAVSNIARVVRFNERLRAAGCRIALDDFGVGMSSFGYLKNLPVDIVKIDGSFIHDLESDPMSYSIVRAVTDIGHQIGLEVVAEWVTSQRSCELLRGLGVDYAQGWVVHRPEPALYDR